MILNKIILTKRLEVKELKSTLKMPAKFDTKDLPVIRDFKSAIMGNSVKLIAETKAASPSAGDLVVDYDPAHIAKIYENAGASAISVLTDKGFFKGDISHIKLVKDSVTLPILRKDFIIDDSQVFEARLAGADAVLLIVRILNPDKLKQLLILTRELGMAALVEAHSVEEARAALDAGADIIGINNRDLDTLKTNIKTTIDIIKALPKLKEKLLVSESGIKTKQDVLSLKEAGISAVLVGESLLKSPDISKKAAELIV